MFYERPGKYLLGKLPRALLLALPALLLLGLVFCGGMLAGAWVAPSLAAPQGKLILAEDWDDHDPDMPPGEPWNVYQNEGTSKALIASPGPGEGVFTISAAPGDDITVAAPWKTGPLRAGRVSACFDARLDEGSDLGFVLIGSGSRNHSYALFHNEQVLAQDERERLIPCGSYTPRVWTHVCIVSDIERQTHSVYVNGDQGRCRDVKWSDPRPVGQADLESFAMFIGQGQTGAGRMDHLLVRYFKR